MCVRGLSSQIYQFMQIKSNLNLIRGWNFTMWTNDYVRWGCQVAHMQDVCQRNTITHLYVADISSDFPFF